MNRQVSNTSGSVRMLLASGRLRAEQAWLLSLLSEGSAAHSWRELAFQADEPDREACLAVLDPMLAPYLHCALAQLTGLRPFERDILDRLSGRRKSAIIPSLRWDAEISTILKVFHEAGIRFAVLKGGVLRQTVYPNPSLRPMNDLDLFVAPDDLAAAQSSLVQAGWSARDGLEASLDALHRGLPPLEVCLYKQIPGAMLLCELHTRLESQGPPFHQKTRDLLPRTRRFQAADGIFIPALHTHDMLQHLCLHLSYHHGFSNGLRWLLDIRLFLAHFQHEVEWEKFIEE